ncbi:hypothetical protein KKD19_02245 [Patescibacteria group bacterium]|nr:hypothetical protein [Patescibacteria group bacterium]MCG2693262.1 hypothetical protein [Candidatus Parcubacteria bacterium]
MRKRTNQSQQKIMERVLNNPKYKGKHVIVVADKIFTANTGDGAARILDKVDKKYPNEISNIAYIPEAESLIL